MIGSRRSLSLLGVVGIVWTSLSLASPPVRADSIFDASADAAAVRTSFADATVVPFLTGGGSDVTSPRAQAVGNSLGTSQALASAAYPGDDIAGLSDLLGLFVPASVPVTPPTVAFPFVVKADGTDPAPADASTAGYSLHARIEDSGAAEGAATSGPSPVLSPGADSTSTAQVATTADGGVQAVAQTRTVGFSLPGLIEIGSVTTKATATRTGTADLKRDANMSVTGGNVMGLPLELRNGKFVIPVLGTSIEVNQAIQSLPVLAPLKSQGVTLEYQAAVTSPNGITAPGIRVTWVHAVPALPLPAVPLPPITPGQPNIGPIPASTATVTYALGFASAQASLAVFPSFGGGPLVDGGLPPASVSIPTAAQPANGALPAVAPVLQQTGGVVLPAPTVATTPDGSAGGHVRQARLLAGSLPQGPDLANIYLVLVVAGLLALGVGQLMRFLGVRTAQS